MQKLKSNNGSSKHQEWEQIQGEKDDEEVVFVNKKSWALNACFEKKNEDPKCMSWKKIKKNKEKD